jgi:hypothetical protein
VGLWTRFCLARLMELTLLDGKGAHPLARMEKLALARRLVAEIALPLPK